MARTSSEFALNEPVSSNPKAVICDMLNILKLLEFVLTLTRQTVSWSLGSGQYIHNEYNEIRLIMNENFPSTCILL